MMFTSGSQHYEKNLTQAGTCLARPAVITKPTGEKAPGVVLFTTAQVRAVLPISEALRLANEIADSIAVQRTAEGK